MPAKHIDGIDRFGSDGRRTPLYRLWLNIRNRCNNPRTPDYKYYGGRGIEVCDRWDSFAFFVADVDPHPGAGWTLDRIDNDGDYEPGNVRWATRKVQARNRPYCRFTKKQASAIRRLYTPGVTSQTDLAAQFGITQTMVSRIIRGLSWR